jgi:hypothetical protein
VFESGDLRDGTTLGQNLSVPQDMVPLRRERMRGGVLRLPFWTCCGIYSDWGRLNRCSFEEVDHHDATYNCDHPCFILASSFARAVDVNYFVISYVMYCISLFLDWGVGFSSSVGFSLPSNCLWFVSLPPTRSTPDVNRAPGSSTH